MHRAIWLAGAGLLALGSCHPAAPVSTRIPAIFSDHMVLQRDRPVPIWGRDDPGASVTVTLGQVRVSTRADSQGAWSVELPAIAAGGPYLLTITGSTTLRLSDVLVGEVWLCSGQSNMELTVGEAAGARSEIAAGDHPRIRHLKVRKRPADRPLSDVPTDGWQSASPRTVGGFSAVGYHFARRLEQDLNVPIGLINSSWGATRIEPWIPPAGYRSVPALKPIADRLDSFPRRDGKGEIDIQSPLALYNGMIHPLVPYAVRGAIWYQGEANIGERMLYLEKMKALIGGWRTLWRDPALPFYFVEVAPYRYTDATMLPDFWEAQQAALAIPHTGMAVTIDIGDLDNFHPANKRDVGLRLALWALHDAYGHQDVVPSGPLYRSMRIAGREARISFDWVGGGLATRDGKAPGWFTLAGRDRKFVDAMARIDGETVVVSSEKVAEPVAVRHAWSQLAEPNLINREGLPAPPFRTDAW